MEENIYIQDLVQQYLDDTLSKEERERMEKRIEEDEDFAKEVAEYKVLLEGLGALGLDAFQDRMDNWEGKYEGTATIRSMTFREGFQKYYSIAAVILVLLLPLGYWVFNSNQAVPPEALYAEYFTPYENLITTRDTDVSKLTKAMSYYSTEDYEQAIPLLEAYTAEKPADVRPNLYLGITLMAENQIDAAIEKFELAKADSLFSEQATWYTALAYCKAGNTEKTKEVLKEIAGQAGPYFNKVRAQELLEEMK